MEIVVDAIRADVVKRTVESPEFSRQIGEAVSRMQRDERQHVLRQRKLMSVHLTTARANISAEPCDGGWHQTCQPGERFAHVRVRIPVWLGNAVMRVILWWTR